MQYQVFIYDHPKTSLTTYLNAYPGLTDWGRLRANFNIVLDWEILRNFYWDLSYYFSYDKKFRPLLNPPRPDQSKFDQVLEWAIQQAENK